MTVETIEISDFLAKRQDCLVIDVRAPIEFEKARMPCAKNVPLFNDEERAIIGTLYKQNGRDEALRKGFDLVGPKMGALIEAVDRLCNEVGSSRHVMVYCARGGMRSESVSWLLDQADFSVTRLEGGYKSYRHNCHQFFERSWNLTALTGMTGSGKTRLLNELAEAGEQVIDLEGLAHHRGSAFGGIGQAAQPSTEMFENEIFEALLKLNPDQRIWIEDESRSIGRCVIPQSFFDQLHAAPAICICVSEEERLDFLIQEYGSLARSEMVDAIKQITKRLGGQNVKAAIESLANGNIRQCAEILLAYYDKTYGICREKNPRQNVTELNLTGCGKSTRVKKILSAI